MPVSVLQESLETAIHCRDLKDWISVIVPAARGKRSFDSAGTLPSFSI